MKVGTLPARKLTSVRQHVLPTKGWQDAGSTSQWHLTPRAFPAARAQKHVADPRFGHKRRILHDLLGAGGLWIDAGVPKSTKSHKQSLSKIQEHRLIIGQIIQALPEKIIRNNLPRRCWQGETKGSCKLFHHDSVFPLGIFSGSSPTTFVVSTQEFAEPRPVAGTVFKLKVVSRGIN